jgi:putative transcriptional regulator
MEKGKYNPSLRLAWKIAQVFDQPIEEVFSFEDEQ